MTRFTENQLILPALFLINLSPTKSLATSELIPKLTEVLKAHNTFERYGFAAYNEGTFTITSKGLTFLSDNMDKLKYLLVNDFSWNDLKEGFNIIQKFKEEQKKIEIFDETICIQEGVKKLVEKKVYKRSVKLRQAAIEYFTKNDVILCAAVNLITINFMVN